MSNKRPYSQISFDQDASSVASISASAVVQSGSASMTENTKYVLKRYLKPNMSILTAKVKGSKAQILKDTGLRYCYDYYALPADNTVTPTNTATYGPRAAVGKRTYTQFLGWKAMNSVSVPDATDLCWNHMCIMLSRQLDTIPNGVNAGSMFPSYGGQNTYFDKVHVKKTVINASNSVCDMWITECHPRDSTTSNAINYMTNSIYRDSAYAASGYDTTFVDT